jgi:hypothetical protein
MGRCGADRARGDRRWLRHEQRRRWRQRVVSLALGLGGRRGPQGRHVHDPRQLFLRRCRPSAELHAGGMAAPDQHPRRADAVQAGRRSRRDQDRSRPGHRVAHADGRRQDLRLPHPLRHPVLGRHHAQAERLCPRVHAAIHRSRPDVVLFRNRRRGQVQAKEV